MQVLNEKIDNFNNQIQGIPPRLRILGDRGFFKQDLLPAFVPAKKVQQFAKDKTKVQQFAKDVDSDYN